MSTLRLIDSYARHYRPAKGSASFTRLDCHACGQPLKTGSKVILESRPGGPGPPNAWHPACFSGEDRQQALQRHRAEHGQYPDWMHPQLTEEPYAGP